MAYVSGIWRSAADSGRHKLGDGDQEADRNEDFSYAEDPHAVLSADRQAVCQEVQADVRSFQQHVLGVRQPVP
jgi:hypothetical protein